MLALFFEVNPRPDGGWDRYLAIAAGLRPLLAEQEGMLFIDRYRSLLRPGTILSHSLWLDEAALAAWRSHGLHHCAQSEGRQQVFDDYRLRIAHVTHTVAPGRDALRSPVRSSYRDRTGSAARMMVVAQGCGELANVRARPADLFESLNREGERLWLFDAVDDVEGVAIACDLHTAGLTARVCEVERDYGMFDRTEAPQYHPPVARLVCPLPSEAPSWNKAEHIRTP